MRRIPCHAVHVAQGRRPTVAEKREVIKLHQDGHSGMAIASMTGFNRGTVKAILNNVANNSGQAWIAAGKEVATPGPRQFDDLPDLAKEALADRTGYLWCKRYWGIELSTWQQIGWEIMEDLYDSVDREFLAENAPPGLGKSTKLVAFASKQIAKNRAIRVLFISRAQSLAERNTLRLRRALERTAPAVGAAATLSGDFGRFKPATSGDVWRRNEFVVEQLDGSPVEEKEPTVSAFGFDSEWLGNRLELVLGDDLDSTRSMRNVETVITNRQVFDDELEPRLEAGGLFMIAQQRLGPFDFSAHALSKRVVLDDDGINENPDAIPQYTHLTFKAHYEDRCKGVDTHRTGSPSYPDGCLLDIRRLTWRDVQKAQNNSRRFSVVYQQADFDETEALVPRIWVDGGRGEDGSDFPGCWDTGRSVAQIPQGLASPNLSVVTCDPSPTKFWSIQWWLVNQPTEQRFLLDLVRQAMDAPDFLDFNLNDGVYTGLLEEWWQRSKDVGAPFTTLIVEANAAQRFMLQYDMFRKWAGLRGVQVIPHQTHRNKADPDYGVQSIAPHYRFGRIRLPGKQGAGESARIASMKLVDEVTRWPNAATDDCVMAQWFLEWNLTRIQRRPRADTVQSRPSWVNGLGLSGPPGRGVRGVRGRTTTHPTGHAHAKRKAG